MKIFCPRCGTVLELSTQLTMTGTPWTIATCSKCGFESGSPELSDIEDLIEAWQQIQD